MSGDRGSPRRARRPGRRAAVRAALAAVAAALTVTATPGAASATTYGTVTPLLDCIGDGGHGTYIAVLGYSNTTGRTMSIPLGWNNVISPAKFDGKQPTTFKAGTYHGAFTVSFTVRDLGDPAPSWRLYGHTLGGSYYTPVTACPPGTTMPAEGNDTGAAVALLAAGIVGVLVVRRFVRRAARAGVSVGVGVG